MIFCLTITGYSYGQEVIETTPTVMTGIASYYHDKFHGKSTANGDTYLKHLFTAAANKFPLNCWVKVTNTRNNKTVIVKITDRMAKNNKRLIDLSRGAAERIQMIHHGLVKVKVELLRDYEEADNDN